MNPYCSRCNTEETYPVKDENRNDIFWFIVDTDDFGDIEIVTQGIDESGDIVSMFRGVTNKCFEYDNEMMLLCPDCALEYMEENENVIIEED